MCKVNICPMYLRSATIMGTTVLRSPRIRLSLTKATVVFALLHCIKPIKHCPHRSLNTVTHGHCILILRFFSN